MRQVELASLEAPEPVEGDKIDGIDGREGVIGHGRSTFGIGSTDADSETFASIPPRRPLPVGDIWGSEVEGEVIGEIPDQVGEVATLDQAPRTVDAA